MKNTLRFVSFLLSLMMLLSLAVIPASSADGKEELIRESYQFIKKIATINTDESIFVASDRCFSIDNVIYDADGKKVNEIPKIGTDNVVNIVAHLDERYAYTVCAWEDGGEIQYGVQLFDALTGELLANRDERFYVDGENGYISIEGASRILGTMNKWYKVGNFPCAYAINLGHDMYLFVSHEEAESETGIDHSKPHEYYDAKSERTFASSSRFIPMSFSEDTGLGIAVNSEGEGILCDRDLKQVSDEVYTYLEYLGDGIYEAENDEAILILDANADVLCSIAQPADGYEVIHDVFESYIITVDSNDIYRIYDRKSYTTDGATYGWYYRIDEETFTVGDGSYEVETDTPDLIYNADGSVTETELNCLIPVKGAKYLLAFDYATEAELLYDRELVYLLTLNEEYENIYLHEYDDLIMAEKKDGSIGFVTYDDHVMIPFEYDFDTTVDMYRCVGENLLISLGYTVDGVNYADIYLVYYHSTPFVDVKTTNWYFEAVKFVNENGLMTGKGEGIFAPDEQMTRAQLVTTLWRLAGSPEVEYTNVFSDVKANKWFTAPIMWAAENGIVNGFADGTFAPNAPLTRDQLAAIMYRYTEFSGGDVSVDGSLALFTDGDTVQKWAQPALKWAIGLGIIRGKPVKDSDKTAIAPKAYTTRAEVATVLSRYIQR